MQKGAFGVWSQKNENKGERERRDVFSNAGLLRQKARSCLFREVCFPRASEMY